MTQQAAPSTGPAPQASGSPAIQRQFVNFAFYKLDPAFRRLGDHEKIQARSEFIRMFQQRQAGPAVPDLQHRRPAAGHRLSALADRRRRPTSFRARPAPSTNRGSAAI